MRGFEHYIDMVGETLDVSTIAKIYSGFLLSCGREFESLNRDLYFKVKGTSNFFIDPVFREDMILAAAESLNETEVDV